MFPISKTPPLQVGAYCKGKKPIDYIDEARSWFLIRHCNLEIISCTPHAIGHIRVEDWVI
jgi:hypothetical protein